MCFDPRPHPAGQPLGADPHPISAGPPGGSSSPDYSLSHLAAPAAGASPTGTPPASRWYAVPGFAILIGCLLLGEQLKTSFALMLPGNILGLFILLALLAVGVVPVRWVEGVARWLLWLLPLLFVPIFVLALRDKVIWSSRGPVLIGVMSGATLLLWAVTGHLTQWLLRRAKK